MNILFVSREYPPETGGGGIGSYVAAITPALVLLGHEVHVLSCDFDQTPRDYIVQGVHIHRRRTRKVRGLGRVFAILNMLDTLNALLQGASVFLEYRRLARNFDVIEYPDWGAEGWALAMWHRRPIVAHLHAPIPVIWKYNGLPISARAYRAISALERFSIKRADARTSPSRHLVDELQRMGWLDVDDVEIMQHPIDSDSWSGLGPVACTEPVVLFLAKLQPIKGAETLIKAIALVRQQVPNAKALFVGSFKPFVQAGGTLDADGCEFEGYVPQTELGRYLSRARVFALPSRFESFSFSALEAMAAGRPVVVTNATGIREFVESTGSGTVVVADDACAFAAGLLPYLRSSVHAEQVGNRARQAVREILDPVKAATRRVELYRRVVSAFWATRKRLADEPYSAHSDAGSAGHSIRTTTCGPEQR